MTVTDLIIELINQEPTAIVYVPVTIGQGDCDTVYEPLGEIATEGDEVVRLLGPNG